jgi:hypothetical protein
VAWAAGNGDRSENGVDVRHRQEQQPGRAVYADEQRSTHRENHGAASSVLEHAIEQLEFLTRSVTVGSTKRMSVVAAHADTVPAKRLRES